ncbi:MAG: hypothetical protein LBR26_15985 [Prevotella sp.]|jgi:hypothetical protein|nr:hypothetical protein [Prevotella sp.]
MNKITYSEKEAACAIGISTRELRRQREARNITFLVKRDGKKILYRPKDIENYLREHYAEYKSDQIRKQ